MVMYAFVDLSELEPCFEFKQFRRLESSVQQLLTSLSFLAPRGPTA